MAHSSETDLQYSIIVPAEAQGLITGYTDMDPWFNQTNDVMRGILMGAGIARTQAISHRNFTVGAFGTALRQTLPDSSHIYRAFHGANEKPDAGGGVNIHAEREVVEAAHETKSTLTAMILYGDNQPDQETGIPFPAIVPCFAVCFRMLQEAESVDDRLTVFSSISPDGKKAMLYTLQELGEAYTNRDPDSLYCTTFDNEIGLFDPTRTDQNQVLFENGGDSSFDDAFTQKITLPVLAHLARERG